LGIALANRGRLAEAEAEFHRALRLRPSDPVYHRNLGNLLRDKGNLSEAEAEYREALRLRPDDPDAHSNLVIALIRQGKPAEAARFFTEALAAHPKLGEDPEVQVRYNAACAAALAGCGQGKDAAKLDEAERARLRRQALDWLRADLDAWRRLLANQPDQARPRVQQVLRMWQEDSDFNGVRGDALAKLPEAERRAWQQLWKDVEQMLKRVNHQGTKDSEKKPHH
jgi:tetratricopeptide (TPR) repeat protein